ncbi:MAG: hypothetical protein Roseis2KO_19510 [Roseivirga sp.]
MKRRNIKPLVVVFGLLLSVNMAIAQHANKPTTATQSSTQLGPNDLNIPNAYLTGANKINIVKVYEVYEANKSDSYIMSASRDPNQVMLTSQYLDGLGRPAQSVKRKASGTNKDVVMLVYYDAFGRESQSFLPFSPTDDDGGFQSSAFSKQKSFYDTRFGGKEDIFYGINQFQASPNVRLLKQMAPGNSWAGNGKGVTNQLLNNGDGSGGTPDHDVKIWTIGNGASDQPVYAGDYSKNSLIMTLVTDEDGRQVRRFSGKNGKVILKQEQLSDSPSTSYNGWLSTYYVYDNIGNLRFTLPPKAVDALRQVNWNYSTSGISNLIFKYVYDQRKRMIIKQNPGAEETYFVYDNLDRMVMKQDGQRRVQNKWSFTKYDEKGRVVLVGLIDVSDPAYANMNERSEFQAEADTWGAQDYFVKRESCDATGVIEGVSITVSQHVAGTTLYKAKDFIEFLPGFDTDEEFETSTGGSVCGDYTYHQGYYDATFPLLKDYSAGNNFEVMGVNYYDDYSFTEKTFDGSYNGFYTSVTDISAFNAIVPEPYLITEGLATGSKVRVLGGADEWMTSIIYFDDRGRTIQAQKDNHKGGTDIVTTQYDFAGRVLHTYTKHTNPAALDKTSTIVLKRFSYDDNTRVTKIEQKLDDTGDFKELVSYEYNELGELKKKDLGKDPMNASAPLETVNYDYNIRGWMQGINAQYAKDGTGNHFFGIEMSFDFGFDENQLNGNMSGVKWRTKSSTRERAYGYTYDNVNRLIGADYNHVDVGETAWNKLANNNSVRDFSSEYTYDSNGNLMTLKRQGVVAGANMMIDDLVYTYGIDGVANAKSNELIKVAESNLGPELSEGFDNPNGSNNDYAYDENGSLTSDANKNISSISYNDNSLPETIVFNGGKTISFIYSGTGEKLSKIVDNNGEITITDYMEGFIYENGQLQFFSHEEGRVRKNGNGDLVYDYFLTDHLGNTRMTITEVPEVVEYRATMEKDIMPTGVKLEDYEESLFLNLEETRESPSNHNTTSIIGITNDEAARLNGTDALRRIGPAKMLAVFPGDQVSLSVESFHAGGASTTYVDTKTQTIDALANVYSQLGGSAAATETALRDLFEGPGTAPSTYVGSQGDISKPRAYLNYLVLNQDFEYIDGGFVQSDQTNGWKTLSTNLNIIEGGYVYVYLSNEHPTSFDVWFDDLTIVHTKSTILQEDHYYPYGMSIDAISGIAPQAKSNDFKFNGFEELTDFDLGWYDYQARQYDPQTGRFLSLDPSAGLMSRYSPYSYAFDNPIRYIDPDGMSPESTGGTEPHVGAYGESLEGTAYNHYDFTGEVFVTEQDVQDAIVDVIGEYVRNGMKALDPGISKEQAREILWAKISDLINRSNVFRTVDEGYWGTVGAEWINPIETLIQNHLELNSSAPNELDLEIPPVLFWRLEATDNFLIRKESSEFVSGAVEEFTVNISVGGGGVNQEQWSRKKAEEFGFEFGEEGGVVSSSITRESGNSSSQSSNSSITATVTGYVYTARIRHNYVFTYVNNGLYSAANTSRGSFETITTFALASGKKLEPNELYRKQ